MVLGLLGRSSVVTAAGAVLLILQVFNFSTALNFLERRGLELGLVLLMISVLVPFAAGRVSPRDLLEASVTIPGIVTILSGAIATHLNGQGLELLQGAPSLMIGLVVGSIIGVVLFGGIPVGPLMAGGIAALILNILKIFLP